MQQNNEFQRDGGELICISMNTDNSVTKAWGGAGPDARRPKGGKWDIYNTISNKNKEINNKIKKIHQTLKIILLRIIYQVPF